jgi:hypothetical protein
MLIEFNRLIQDNNSKRDLYRNWQHADQYIIEYSLRKCAMKLKKENFCQMILIIIQYIKI